MREVATDADYTGQHEVPFVVEHKGVGEKRKSVTSDGECVRAVGHRVRVKSLRLET